MGVGRKLEKAVLTKQQKQKTLKVTKLLQQGNCNAE